MAFVKICGMTDARAVEAALLAGADAIGFVLAPSVRRVTAAQAAQLAAPARGRALCVAVTLHPDAALLDEIFTQFQPDVLQTDLADLPSIALPPGVVAWPVLRGAPGAAATSLSNGQRVLFEGLSSGAGKLADWTTARELGDRYALILAGGLRPSNVVEAIEAVRPYGVDVSSGVEESPGRKSAELIESFVTRARAAFALRQRRALTWL
jgi:phosphoribosylanthranilate isomerase